MQRIARVPSHPLAKQIEFAQAQAKAGTLEFARDLFRLDLIQTDNTKRQASLGGQRAVEALIATGRYKGGEGGNWTDEQRDVLVERQYALGLVASRGVWKGLHYATERANTPVAKEQVELVRSDIKTVQDEFRDRVRTNAFALLDDSQNRIVEMLRGYGLTTAYAGDFVDKVAMDDDELESVVDDWLLRSRGKGNRSSYEQPKAAGARADLTKRIDALRGLQKAVVDMQVRYMNRYRDTPLTGSERRDWDKKRKLVENIPVVGVDDIKPEARKLEGEINAARLKLETAWIEAEREHPVLAAHRGREPHLEWVDLAGYSSPLEIGSGSLNRGLRIVQAARAFAKPASSEGHEQAAVREGVRKLANIHRARLAIRQDKLSPLKLAPVVHFTEKQLFIAPRSAWAVAVNEVVDPEKGVLEEGLEFVEDLFNFAMLVLTVLPTPLQPVAALYDAGKNAYVALDEYVKYDLEKSYADTDLDVARSLSDKVPSLTGFMLALLGAGLSLAQVKSVFKAAAEARAGLVAGEEGAVAKLNQIGEQHGVKDLGEEVSRLEGKAVKPAKAPDKPVVGTGTPPSGGKPVLEEDLEAAAKQKKKTGSRPYDRRPRGGGGGTGAAPRPRTPKPETRVLPSASRVFHTTAADLQKGLGKALGGKAVTAEARAEFEALIAHVRKYDPGFAAQAEQYFKALNDPELIKRKITELWKQAGDADRVVAEQLEQRLGGGVNNYTISGLKPEKEYEAFKAVLEDARTPVDLSFAMDEHGAHTHAFQQFLGDALFGPGGGRAFRKKLAELGGPVRTLQSGVEQPFWSQLWDVMFDAPKTSGQLNSPEILGKILQDQADFPRWYP